MPVCLWKNLAIFSFLGCGELGFGSTVLGRGATFTLRVKGNRGEMWKAVIPINSRVLGWRVFVRENIERTSVDYFRGGRSFDGPGVPSSSDSF
jgi:hypothetical protein